MFCKRSSRCLAVVLLLFAHALGVNAQDFPTQPLRLVVPYTASGPGDTLARIIAERLAPRIGKPVLVENRPGANTMIAARFVAGAPADGHTLLLDTTSIATNTLIVRDPGYTIDDFVPLAAGGLLPIVFVAPPSTGARSLAEFVAYVKERQGQLNYSTTGSFTEMLTDRFTSLAGLKMVAVPYKGAAEGTLAVVAGNVQLSAAGVSVAVSLIKAGKLQALAVASEQRAGLLPDVPTFKELGYPDMLGAVWLAVSVRARTPAPIAERLRQVLNEVVTAAEYRAKITGIGIDVWPTRPEDLRAFVRNDLRLWQGDVKRMGIKPE